MKNDITPQSPQPQPLSDVHETQPSAAATADAVMQSESAAEQPLVAPEAPPRPKKRLQWIVVGLVALIVASGAALFVWYKTALQPVSSGDVASVRVTIEPGSSPNQIGTLLEEKKIIRSNKAFDIYTRISDVRGSLQAGTFSLSPADSTQQIVEHLLSGKNDQYSVTFFPGATLNTARLNPDKTPSHRQVFENQGFTTQEIDDAFSADYSTDFPTLFAGKPQFADLEGYIYGETYNVASGSTVKQILMRTFAEFEAEIIKENITEQYKQRGLSLYEGITLASIVQREALSPAGAVPSDDQKQIAQVFYTRIGMGMPLGSDVTFIYAAKKLGVEPISTLDSPYNTRIQTGLPPGPISSPGASALRAVASPAAGDYVYFVAGDDGKTYFGRTLEQHEDNVSKYCTVECAKP